MKTICVYTSDYGYGHAARDIAIVREIIAKNQDFSVIIKTSGPYEFVRKSLSDLRITVIRCQNDISFPNIEGTSGIDREKTRVAFLQWMDSWDAYISSECTFCREHRIDLIISDIAPQPFCIAEKLGIPGIAVSNFSWDTIYEHLFPGMAEIDSIRNAYHKASSVCVLPFEIGMDAYPGKINIGLISRKISVPRQVMRRQNGIGNDELLIYVGQVPQPDGFSIPCAARGKGVRFLVPSGQSCRDPSVISIPHEETESQNWLAMCDIVITKCGYSTVSEAVRARVPLIVWKRDGFIEDEAIAGKIEHCGIGMTASTYTEGISFCLDNTHVFKKFRQKFHTLENVMERDGLVEICRVINHLMN